MTFMLEAKNQKANKLHSKHKDSSSNGHVLEVWDVDMKPREMYLEGAPTYLNVIIMFVEIIGESRPIKSEVCMKVNRNKDDKGKLNSGPKKFGSTKLVIPTEVWFISMWDDKFDSLKASRYCKKMFPWMIMGA